MKQSLSENGQSKRQSLNIWIQSSASLNTMTVSAYQVLIALAYYDQTLKQHRPIPAGSMITKRGLAKFSPLLVEER